MSEWTFETNVRAAMTMLTVVRGSHHRVEVAAYDALARQIVFTHRAIAPGSQAPGVRVDVEALRWAQQQTPSVLHVRVDWTDKYGTRHASSVVDFERVLAFADAEQYVDEIKRRSLVLLPWALLRGQDIEPNGGDAMQTSLV